MLVLVLAGLFVLRGYGSGSVQELFKPTPTPTRTSGSYSFEGQTHFQAGNLDAAIQAYKGALETNPSDARLWQELARVQTYSSNLLTTNEQRRQRLADALVSADNAVKYAPDDGTAHAVRAFVMDWNAALMDDKGQHDEMLIKAELEAQQALVKDPNNALALAFSAEILTDEGKLDQAQQYITQAKAQNENLMDVQRVRALILETLGDYQGAIDAYDRAIEISPNLTFLYIRAGVIYRYLGMRAPSESPSQKQYYDTALEYFAKAVNLNKQLNINDPVPYIAIGKVYTQEGEFFIASRNAQKALQIDPTSPDLYGQLGMVYFKARNYESAIPALQCAVEGCPPAVSCEVRECIEGDAPVTIQGIPLTVSDSATAVYYYTYGSVLAGLHRPAGPTADYCQRALKVFDKVRGVFASDPTIMNIVGASEDICASFGITRSGGEVVTATAAPTADKLNGSPTAPPTRPTATRVVETAAPTALVPQPSATPAR
jgi:tetratricopeptide (TPR) repeat protein